MSGKIKIVMMTLCLVFSHLSLAVDFVTTLLLREPLVMNIGDVPVEIRSDHGVITLAIPAGNTSNAPQNGGQGRTSQPVIQGRCDTDNCTVVSHLHAIQQLLESRNIQELALTLTPFQRASTITHYSDDAATRVHTCSSGDGPCSSYVCTHTSDRSSANFVLNLSFISDHRRVSVNLPYLVRRGSYPMDWLWGRHFFNAHYGRQDSVRYFDPLQEGVLEDVVNVLHLIQRGDLSQHLHQFPLGETVNYDPCLLNRDTVQIGNEWLQPLGSVEATGPDSNGRSQRRSTVTSGAVRYSVTLPHLSNQMPFTPMIDVTLLPSLSEQLVDCSRVIIVAAAAVMVAVVGIIYQSSGNQRW